MLPGLEQRLTGRVCLRIMPPCSFKLATDSTVPVEKNPKRHGRFQDLETGLGIPSQAACSCRSLTHSREGSSGDKRVKDPEEAKQKCPGLKERNGDFNGFVYHDSAIEKKGFNLRNSEFNHIKPQVHQQKTRFLPKHGGVSAL